MIGSPGYSSLERSIHDLPPGIPLSRNLQNLSFRYTKWITWSENRIGDLFHGREKAVMAAVDNYLAQLVAYLHLNPVRVPI